MQTPQTPTKPIENLEDGEQAPPGTFDLGNLEPILILGLESTIVQSSKDRDVHFQFPSNPSVTDAKFHAEPEPTQVDVVEPTEEVQVEAQPEVIETIEGAFS